MCHAVGGVFPRVLGALRCDARSWHGRLGWVYGVSELVNGGNGVRVEWEKSAMGRLYVGGRRMSEGV